MKVNRLVTGKNRQLIFEFAAGSDEFVLLDLDLNGPNVARPPIYLTMPKSVARALGHELLKYGSGKK